MGRETTVVQRMEAYDEMQELRQTTRRKPEILRHITRKHQIPKSTVKNWIYQGTKPWGRKGKIERNPSLAYAVGALLGDGCLYRYKPQLNHVILTGSKKFTEKFALHLNECTNTKAVAYPNRSNGSWFVKVNNYELYCLFEAARKNLAAIAEVVKGKEEALLFIEGFFDAEGCVKVIGRKRRKTPKICLDITNTRKEFLDTIQNLLNLHLGIASSYSIQKPIYNKTKKTAYHLRIYKKSYIRRFFQNIQTIKLKEEKKKYVEQWLNNGLGS